MPAVVGEDTVVAMRARQRDRFGGIRWGSAFFGLLSAIGLAALLLGIVAAAGVAIGVSEIENVTNGDADTIGLGGAILVLAAIALSWYCGGYVAGRMARFDGARQGIGVWAWTIAIGAALAIAAVIGGSEYDVLQQLNLPNVAVGDESLTTDRPRHPGRRRGRDAGLRHARRQGRRDLPPPGRPLRGARVRRRAVGAQRADQPRSIVSGTPVIVRPPGPRR